MKEGIGILEITGLTPALVALDRLDKAASVRLLQMELNDFYGVVFKFSGSASDLRSAVEAGRAAVEQMGGQCQSAILDAPDDEALRAIMSKKEVSPLLEAPVVFFPNYEPAERFGSDSKENVVLDRGQAIGLIETQGFTAVLEAVDAACKAANVEVMGKEKLGGGYVAVLIRGDVAAVQTAVEVGKSKVGSLGKLIAAHVIPRPSEAVQSLLPKG